ncbi:MAG: helix-turn-helix domain-containing protein [Pseudomonadales bacterium]
MFTKAVHQAPCNECPTRQLCLAQGLDAEGLTELSSCVDASAPLGRGDYLYRAGDGAVSSYVVRSGVFKTIIVTPTGEEYVTGFHYPGELIGISALATGCHTDTAVALDTSTACRVHLEELPTLWGHGSGLSLLRLIGEIEQAAQRDHINLSQGKADARVAGFLMSLSRRMHRLGRDPDVLYTPMSRTDLASHLGMTLESLSRVLSRFAKAGFIRASRREIDLVELETLETLAGHLPE